MNREVFYAVELKQKRTGQTFIAHGGHSGPALFYWRRDAIKFRNELGPHGMVGKVIRVSAEWETSKSI